MDLVIKIQTIQRAQNENIKSFTPPHPTLQRELFLAFFSLGSPGF